MLGGNIKKKVSLFLLISAAGIVYVLSLDTDKFGFYHDDGMYVVSAKALATGHGYRVISLPSEPLQTKYPPLYPAALSLLWRVAPEFPANLYWLMALSAACTLAFLFLSLLYFVRRGYANQWHALAAVCLAAFNWRTVSLATSTLSEAMNAALSIAALWMAERSLEREGNILSKVLLGIVMASAALTRASGIALVVAFLLHGLIRRQVRRAWLPAFVAGLIFLSWMLWVGAHQPSTIPREYGSQYAAYLEDLKQAIDDASGYRLIPASLASIAGRNLWALLVSIPAVCLNADSNWYEGMNALLMTAWIVVGSVCLALIAIGFLRHARERLKLFHCYALAYLSLHLVWPYSLFDRFLFPLLPFLLLLLLGEAVLLARTLTLDPRRSDRFFPQVAAGVVGLLLMLGAGAVWYRSTLGLYAYVQSSKARFAILAAEEDHIFSFIRANTAPQDILICYRDPVYYLRTGRRAVRLPTPAASDGSGAEPDRLLQFASAFGARYLIRSPADFDQDPQPAVGQENLRRLMGQRPENFVLMFKSSTGRFAVYRIQERSGGNVR